MWCMVNIYSKIMSFYSHNKIIKLLSMQELTKRDKLSFCLQWERD